MRPSFALVVPLSLLLVAAPARGGELQGTRVLGLGGAIRGAATGDAGILFNPSGLSLMKLYALEGAYQLATADQAHFAHVSVVDSTSSYNIGAGLYYTFLANTDDKAIHRRGHEAGLALSLPLGERLSV